MVAQVSSLLEWHPDERWQIAAEYQQGASINSLANKYDHDWRTIRKCLVYMGIPLRTRTSQPKKKDRSLKNRARTMNRPSVPSFRKLAWAILRAEEIVGRRLKVREIERAMEEIRHQNGGEIMRGPEVSYCGM